MSTVSSFARALLKLVVLALADAKADKESLIPASKATVPLVLPAIVAA